MTTTDPPPGAPIDPSSGSSKDTPPIAATQTVTGSQVGGDLYQIAHAGFVHITGRPPRRPRLMVTAVLVAVCVAMLAVVLLVVSTRPPPAGPAPASGTVGPPPGTDITIHEVWASSAANVRHELSPAKPGKQAGWAMTDFLVTVPFIRSVEAAVGPNAPGSTDETQKVLFRVLDEHGEETAQGAAGIVDYRAKYVFSNPVNVREYLGKRLFLEVRNISSAPMRVYLTPHDQDRSVTSYLPCGAAKPTLCPNPEPRDLSVLVIGRHDPW